MKLRFAAPLLLLGFGLASPAAFAGVPLKHRIRVDSFRVERDVTPGRNKVVGTLTNVSRAPVRTAKIRFRLFDARGRGIGMAVDEVHDLGPGKTWKFHARALGNVSRAHLLSVQAE
jgi:hypothetical protein